MALLAYFICFFIPSGKKLCYYPAARLDQMISYPNMMRAFGFGSHPSGVPVYYTQ